MNLYIVSFQNLQRINMFENKLDTFVRRLKLYKFDRLNIGFKIKHIQFYDL